jgi:RimJ/RimL family protein N-acetyltransferase
MAPTAFLHGDRVELHPMEPDDATFVQSIRNDPQIRAGIGGSTPMTAADHENRLDDRGDDVFDFVVRVDGDPVGTATLWKQDVPWGYAEIGYAIHPDHWNQGYATEAVECLVRYGFREQRYNKIGADAYETNPASNRVLEKAGFEREGVRRSHAFVEGEYVDVHEYGLLADEWRE